MSRTFTLRELQHSEQDAQCMALADSSLEFFAGHFEGAPVLPAVAQLDALVLELARKSFPDLGLLRRATRLKFRRPIVPGDDLCVRIERRAAPTNTPTSTLAFTITCDDVACADGLLVFEAASA